MRNVLVVDDKPTLRDSIAGTLQRAGMNVVTAEGAERALEAVALRRPDAVVTDLKMPGMSGVELLARIRAIDDDLPVIVMTAFGTIESAVEAMRLGAYDFLTKPFEGDALIIAVKRAIEHASVVRENAILRAGEIAINGTAGADDGRGMKRIIGESRQMQVMKDSLAAIAASHGTVLISGESGVGKEVVARAIHEAGPRAAGPFVAVNCAAISESLLESELFGHERGAFTGAEKLRKGRFELADSGTLLLDEVSEVSPRVQAKLLRVLQERAFERVGSSVTMGVDVRVIATSNRDLPKSVESGEFRRDLYFRLNVLPVHVPPLRDRRDDVAALASSFIHRFAAREGLSTPVIDDDAAASLAAYAWPGNVRELQNVCERAVVLGATGNGRVTRSLIEPWLGPTEPSRKFEHSGVIEVKSDSPPPDSRTLEEIEREAIVRTLGKFSGHRQRTASALGIGVRTLGLKLKRWKELHLVPDAL